MVLLGLARVLAVEQPFEVESQVAAVVRLEVANTDSALSGASWIRNLRNLRRTLTLRNPPTESERLDAWQDPDDREQQQYGHLFPPSPDPVVVPAPPTPESQFPKHLVSVNVVRFGDSSGRFL